MNTSETRGFSLIEMLVAVAIFTIVMTVAAGALITMLGVNLKNRTVTIATNNLNVAVESMSRSIQDSRSAYTIAPGGTSISFEVSDAGTPVTVTYTLAPSPSGSGNSIFRSIGGAAAQPITADDINITRLNFRASEYGSGTGQNILVTIAGEVGDPANPAESTELVVQTTISQQLQFVPGGPGGADALAGGPYGPNIYCPFEPGPGIFVLNFEHRRGITPDNYLVGNDIRWRVPRAAMPNVPAPGPCTPGTCDYYDLTELEPDPDTGVPYQFRGGIVPPGTYDVYVASFDIHCGGPPLSGNPADNCLGQHATQEYEQAYIEVYDASHTRLYDPVADVGSGAMITDTVPDNANYGEPTLVATDVAITSPIRYAAAFYAWHPGSPIPGSGASGHSVVVACAAFVGPGTVPTGPTTIPVEIEQF